MSETHRPADDLSFEFWWRQYRRDVISQAYRGDSRIEQMDALLMPAAKAAFNAGFKKGWHKGKDGVELYVTMEAAV